MTLDASDYLDARDTLIERGFGSSVTVSCTDREASDLRAFLFRNGIEVEIRQQGPDDYRFTRTDDEGVPA